MNIWEATSYEIEKLQANPACVRAERKSMASRKGLSFNLTFDPNQTILNHTIGQFLSIPLGKL